MNYIVIQPSATHTSAQRAWLLSGLLFDIVKHPTSTGTAFLFNVVEHPDGVQAALEIDVDYPMPLQNEAPLALLVDELSDTAGVEQAAQWAASMVGNMVTFGDLLPEGVVVYTWDDLNENGWFVTEETEI